MGKVRIQAKVTFLTEHEGGRKRPAWNFDKYRPHVVVGDPEQRRTPLAEDGRTATETYLGVCFDGDGEEMLPGKQYVVSLVLPYYGTVEYSDLVSGATFTIREGHRIVGFGEVLESPFLPEEPGVA